MKTLLPVLKTKLFLLGFVSACTVILATTVPTIRNFIAPQKAIGEKITTEQKKIATKTKTQNKTVSSSRVTAGLSLEMNNLFDATVQTDKADYVPGEYVVITGSGWQPSETVSLNIVSDCGCTNEIFYAVADASGNIENSEFLILEWHLGATFFLTATGLTSDLQAQTIFTDASTVTPGSGLTITADRAANAVSPAYTTLTDITIQEGLVDDFTPGTNLTLILSSPSGWTFETSQGSVSFQNSRNVTATS